MISQLYERVVVAKPPVGAKCVVLDRRGSYLLEEDSTSGVLLHVTCTHAGSGAILVSDLDGRRLLDLSPSAMGVWHLGAGFHHGLVLQLVGGSVGLAPIASIVWYTRAEKQSELVLARRKSECLPNGKHVLTRKNSILYEVLVTKGSAGHVEIQNGEGRALWRMPSMFRGSFNLEHVYAEAGLVALVETSVENSVSVTWLEE